MLDPILNYTEWYIQLILANLIIINIIMLILYHKTLLTLFNKTFNRRRYEEEQKQEQFMQYDDLSKDERRALRKEYYNKVNPRVKFLFVLVCVVFLAVLGVSGYSMYMVIVLAFARRAYFWMWYVAALPMSFLKIIMFISRQPHQKYALWLYDKKGIMSDNVFLSKHLIKDSNLSKSLYYKELPKQKRRELFKEYAAPKKRSVISWQVASYALWGGMFLAIIWAVIGMLGDDLTVRHYVYYAGLMFFGVISSIDGFLFIQIMQRKEFYDWLESEKGILRAHAPKSI